MPRFGAWLQNNFLAKKSDSSNSTPASVFSKGANYRALVARSFEHAGTVCIGETEAGVVDPETLRLSAAALTHGIPLNDEATV